MLLNNRPAVIGEYVARRNIDEIGQPIIFTRHLV
jgi:hypothetical protein